MPGYFSQRQYTTKTTWSRIVESGKARSMLPDVLVAKKNYSSQSDKLDSWKSLSNPGLTREDFQALFQSASNRRLKHKVYPRRWDWHLRMFLYCLVPPISIYIFTVIVDYFLLNDDDIVEILDLTEVRRANQAAGYSWFYGLWGWWNFETPTEDGEKDEPGQEGQEIDSNKSAGEDTNPGITLRLERRLSIIEKQFKALYEELARRDEKLAAIMSQYEEGRELQIDEEADRGCSSGPKAKSADEIVAAAREVSHSMTRPSPSTT